MTSSRLSSYVSDVDGGTSLRMCSLWLVFFVTLNSHSGLTRPVGRLTSALAIVLSGDGEPVASISELGG